MQKPRFHGRDHRPGGADPIGSLSHDWIYWGSYPTDPFTTADSPDWGNSWGNVGGSSTPTEPTRVRLSPDDNLEFEGSFEGGISGTSLGDPLPAALRPDYPKTILVISKDTLRVPYAIDVGTDGVCTVWELLVTGSTGSTGPTGATGATGATGDPGGLKYVYSTNTASSDPTSGHVKFDTTTLASISALRISETDADGNAIAALLQSLDDSSSGVRATLTMIKEGAPGNRVDFQITGAFTDNGTWDSCTITAVSATGSFANGDTVRLLFSRTGDKGDTGSAGSAGHFTVATSLPGSPGNGDAVLLRCGSTPYDFMFLVYDSTYGKWVSDAQICQSDVRGTGSHTSYSDLGGASGDSPMIPWKVLDTAGLKPQYRLTLMSSTDAVHAVFGALQVYSTDVGSSLAADGAVFAVLTTATNLISLDSGWTDIPGGLTVRDLIGTRLQFKQALSGSGTVFQVASQIRWVSK